MKPWELRMVAIAGCGGLTGALLIRALGVHERPGIILLTLAINPCLLLLIIAADRLIRIFRNEKSSRTKP